MFRSICPFFLSNPHFIVPTSLKIVTTVFKLSSDDQYKKPIGTFFHTINHLKRFKLHTYLLIRSFWMNIYFTRPKKV
ncbi:hypothetical protein QVD17_27906 [Tagetes erecta]|uniref:Uncharacterized protein n=1 Tax=Tagetes erecta TaxID=13708 RepID=A0AAD8K9E3_TARER|nr:hypothetical protein QVD17_27906 [Tagetes erecta]